jgi:RNA polymerase sigma factor (sigma-70 family)
VASAVQRRVNDVVGTQHFAPDEPFAVLVAAAIAGDQTAWNALVGRLERVVWKSVNMMTYDHEVRNDAFAATWLRLAERLDSIREPEELPGWLATTACNEVRQVLRHRSRHDVSLNQSAAGLSGLGERISNIPDDLGDHERELVGQDERRRVREVFGRLDDQCRELLTVLVMADPPIPYDEASEQLGRPVGSLGPARGRCLEKMRSMLEVHGENDDQTGRPRSHRDDHGQGDDS